MSKVLETAQVQATVVTYLKDTCNIATTTDLINYFAEAAFETEVKEVLVEKFPVSDTFKTEEQRLYISRLRAAYRLAQEANLRLKSESQKPAEIKDEDNVDLERALDPASVDRLEATWMQVHGFKLVNFMKPAPQFRNRLFREMHQRSARLVPVEKVRSMEDTRLTSEPEQVNLGALTADGSKLVLQSASKQSRRITDCLEYLTALRILMQTYAYVGSHKVASSADVSKQVPFFPLDVAIGYVDEVTQATLAMVTLTERERLEWLRRRDEQVRSETVALINDGFSGGEALKTSWSKLAHIWVIRDGAAAADSSDGGQQRGQVRARSEPKGKGGGKDKGKKGKTAPDDFHGVRRASTHNGMKFCGAFNGKRGCVRNEKSCPQGAKHQCSVIKPNGDVCRSTAHGACGHF